MRKFFRTLLLLFILYISWPFIEKQLEQTDFYPVLDRFKDEVQAISDNPQVSETIETIYSAINQLAGKMNEKVELLPNKDPNPIDKPKLSIPSNQTFSIHNIVLGESKENVEKLAGTPKRTTYNEYGTKWYTYHENYHNFFMVTYDTNQQVSGLYTNQDLISSAKGIKLGSTKEDVLQQLGKPLNQIRKGLVFYQFEKERDYDVFSMDQSYVTVFYDKHVNNTVTAIQMIDDDLEQAKNYFYANESQQLKEGFEYQLFDLTNADRVKHGKSVLKWDDHVKETARSHSLDMAEKNYFSHTNLEGQSPFDRMSEDQVSFTAAGENLAMGQFSSIFAHEGLMNSLGHRENILRPEYQYLGVGVAFNSKSQPYYTEKFFRK
ncbi:CAP domain-containing protein [Bacillus sp. DTU_2020_1000418_1_SI_GHA_SEK_038]|uniref:CAP domain-containing protein n=1 Tax=Bacillus sp. DTU_2020_1000418_1_SI_GHA_SEK_038 TaxID=3077585 RepID=UPI0028EABB90|nr:CAP domain-containing protein [Bacillus sp. DTU_2020_1000418_1_SI_GHA_SEK_038]WNS73575.1 CAP domain-containing protein [Bacillus sp. DTU_2020_1000418_1_SI_GHA_SEK_038]